MKKVNGILASAAVAAFVLAQPALASATRSASALPLAGMAQAGGAGTPAEYCGKYGNSENVKLDGAGNPVLDANGNLQNCGRAANAPGRMGKGAVIVGAGLLGIITVIATNGGGGDDDDSEG